METFISSSIVVRWVHWFYNYSQLVYETFLTFSPSSVYRDRRHWFRYIDDVYVKIQKSELDSFSKQLAPTLSLPRRDVNNGTLPFLDYDVTVQDDGTLNTTVYRKATHTDQYSSFDSHHPLIHKLGVIRTLFHKADNIPSTELEQSQSIIVKA